MRQTTLALVAILLLANCSNSEHKTGDENRQMELVPEPDNVLREEYEKQNTLGQAIRSFSDPDTSVNGIKIDNAESVLDILGKQTKLEGGSTQVFYSTDKKQKLGLTVHHGSDDNQVSIFSVSYSNNLSQNFRQINSKEFETEKGIKLGINKEQIIEKLGTLYAAKDSSKESIELYYRLELPKDSKTNLLKRNNMPIYYATYKLKNDKLENFEFGFEYP